MFRSATSVQAVPFQDSLLAFAGSPPPKAKADVLLDPTPPNSLLAVFMSATSAHEVPFQDSLVFFVSGVSAGLSPAKAKADVTVPDPAIFLLPLFKSAISAQEVPFHCSTIAVTAPVVPDIANAAVCVPTPKVDLAVFKSAISVQEVPSYDSFAAE